MRFVSILGPEATLAISVGTLFFISSILSV